MRKARHLTLLFSLILVLCSSTEEFDFLPLEDLKRKPIYTLSQALIFEENSVIYRLAAEFSDSYKTMSQFPNLQALTLLDSGTRVPTEIAAFSHLRILDLSKNPEVTDIRAISTLLHLEELSIASVELTELPEEMSVLSNLHHVEIRVGKNLRDIHVLEYFTCMDYLELSDCNQIERFPSHLPGLRYLKTSDIFTLVNIQLVLQKGGNIDSLKYLDLNACTDIQDATQLIPNFKGLKRLNLASNPNLNNVQFIKNLPELEELNLSYCNQLEVIPESFSTLKNLKILNLSFNSNLRDISGIANLENLQTLIIPNIELLETLPKEQRKKLTGITLVIKNNIRQEKGVVFY